MNGTPYLDAELWLDFVKEHIAAGAQPADADAVICAADVYLSAAKQRFQTEKVPQVTQ